MCHYTKKKTTKKQVQKQKQKQFKQRDPPNQKNAYCGLVDPNQHSA